MRWSATVSGVVLSADTARRSSLRRSTGFGETRIETVGTGFPESRFHSSTVNEFYGLCGQLAASYFTLSQVNVRTVFLPVAGSFEGSVVSVIRSPSKL